MSLQYTLLSRPDCQCRMWKFSDCGRKMTIDGQTVELKNGYSIMMMKENHGLKQNALISSCFHNFLQMERSTFMRRKWKSGLLLAVLCVFLMGMTVSAAESVFWFAIEQHCYDPGVWTVQKDNNVQTAYIKPTQTNGTGHIFAAVYDLYGGNQYSIEVPIYAGSSGTIASNYLVTVNSGTTCRLIGGDPDWTVTSSSFGVLGSWIP